MLYVGNDDGNKLNLDQTDHHIDIQVTYIAPLGSGEVSQNKTFSISKGTAAALCFSFGGESPQITSQFYDDFTKQNKSHSRLSSLLAFVGMSYFEKCNHAEKTLADLHKITSKDYCFAFGLC